MSTILVISDTHLREGEELPRLIQTLGREVDLIIHAGDFVSLSCLTALQDLGQVAGVCGNMDAGLVAAQLPEERLVEFAGYKIGVVHDLGYAASDPLYLNRRFRAPDIVISGHTHIPANRLMAGIRLFNPGSITRPRHGGGGTYGLIECSGDRFDCRIFDLSRVPFPMEAVLD